MSWGNVVEALLINLLLLAYYLTGPLTVITAASTVRPAPCTVLTAASTVRTAPYTVTTAASPHNTIAVRLLWFSYFRITLVQTPVLTQTLHCACTPLGEHENDLTPGTCWPAFGFICQDGGRAEGHL